MHALRRREYVAAITLLAARVTSAQRVGNDDAGIQYRGLWVHTTFSDDDGRPEALVGTNVSGSTATYNFRGTGISVFGAFPVVGTFNIRSTYSIDGGTPQELLPADTITTPTFHQRFFEVDTLSDDEHTLVITNTGQDYWLDYLAVTTTQSTPSPTTTARSNTQARSSSATAESTTLPGTRTLSPSTVQSPLPTTDSATTSSITGLQTTQSVPNPSSQDTHSFSSTENATLTSMDASAAAPSADPNSTRQSPTSTLASGIASPTDTSARAHSTRFPAGAIAGLAVAGILTVIVVGLVGYRWGRRKQGTSRRQGGLPSNGPGPTTLAFERSEKRDLEHDDNSVISAIGVGVSGSRSEREGEDEMDDVSTASSDGTNMPRDRRTVSDPLDPPSYASPLPVQHGRMGQLKGSIIQASAESSQYVIPCEERRSVDGGVRLAGGPPGDVGAFDDQEDIRSGISTLPPEYQVYPAA